MHDQSGKKKVAIGIIVCSARDTLCGSQLHRLEVQLRGEAANDNGKVVRRARCVAKGERRKSQERGRATKLCSPPLSTAEREGKAESRPLTSRAKRLDLLFQEGLQALLVEESLGLLKQECLVGRAATLGDELRW